MQQNAARALCILATAAADNGTSIATAAGGVGMDLSPRCCSWETQLAAGEESRAVLIAAGARPGRIVAAGGWTSWCSSVVARESN